LGRQLIDLLGRAKDAQRVTRAKDRIRGRVYDDFPGFATNGYNRHAESFPNSCLTEILPG